MGSILTGQARPRKNAVSGEKRLVYLLGFAFMPLNASTGNSYRLWDTI